MVNVNMFFQGDAKLNGKHDIVRHDLKPNEQYKSVSRKYAVIFINIV